MRFRSEIPVWAMTGGLLAVLLSACDAPSEKAALPPPFAGQRGAPLPETISSRPAAAALTFPQEAGKPSALTGTAPQDLLPRHLQSQSAAVSPSPMAPVAPEMKPSNVAGGAPSPAGQAGEVVVPAAPLIEGPTPIAAKSIPKASVPGATAGMADNTDTSDIQVTSTVPAAGTAAHLASYRALDQARRGWSILSASHAELASLTPLYVSVDIPGKGHFLRLYGRSDNPAQLADICHGLQATGTYCALSIGR